MGGRSPRRSGTRTAFTAVKGSTGWGHATVLSAARGMAGEPLHQASELTLDE